MLVNSILFASREFDAETGLYYNRARYLDPTTGRWTSFDPIRYTAGDVNLYSTVFNAPTNFTDPSGQIVWFFVIAGAAAGWYLLGPGAGTANAPAPGQENFRPPPRPFVEDAVAGIPGAIGGADAALAGEAVVAGAALLRPRPGIVPNDPIDPNKLHHIFGKPQHNLGQLLNQFGGNQQAAYQAVQNAAQAAVQQQGIAGVFEIVVNVGGVNVTVRGNVINGVVHIGTFFVR